MFKNKKTLKATVLSMAMAAFMLLPLTTNAQYDENKFGLQEWGQSGLLGKQGSGGARSEEGSDISNYGIGQSVPLGSGIGFLLVAGLGYVALKKKED